MSIINMSMGYFHISVDVTKNKAKIKNINFHSIKHDEKMKRTIYETKALAQNFSQFNIY